MEQAEEGIEQVVDTPEEDEVENPEVNEAAEENADESETEGDDDEVIVSIEGETPPEQEDESKGHPNPHLIKDLRKLNREKAKQIRDLEAKIAAANTSAPKEAEAVGTEPSLESCEYDEPKFKASWIAWNAKKAEQDKKAQELQERAKAEQSAWKNKLAAYGVAAAKLKVSDFEDAEDATTQALDTAQQGILIVGPESPEASSHLVYALGKNPKKLKELAAIKDPVKFAFAVAKLETQLKVTPRKTPPAPETVVRGSASVSGVVDSQLAKLEAQADKSGDRTAVYAYKKKLKEKQTRR